MCVRLSTYSASRQLCDILKVLISTFHRNITLLHYLITILEKKYPKVMQFQEDLQNVPEAAKVK